MKPVRTTIRDQIRGLGRRNENDAGTDRGLGAPHVARAPVGRCRGDRAT